MSSRSDLLRMRHPANSLAAHALLFVCGDRVPVPSKLVRFLLQCDIYNFSKDGIANIRHPEKTVVRSDARIDGRFLTLLHQLTIGARSRVASTATIEEGPKASGAVKSGRDATLRADGIVERNVSSVATVVGANGIVGSAP